MSTVIIAVGAHTAENLPEQAVTKLYDMEEAKSTVGTIYHRFDTEVISVVHRWRKHGGLSPANMCRATVNCYTHYTRTPFRTQYSTTRYGAVTVHRSTIQALQAQYVRHSVSVDWHESCQEYSR